MRGLILWSRIHFYLFILFYTFAYYAALCLYITLDSVECMSECFVLTTTITAAGTSASELFLPPPPVLFPLSFFSFFYLLEHQTGCMPLIFISFSFDTNAMNLCMLLICIILY